MRTRELDAICANADMIVCGYAFTRKDDSNMEVLHLHAPHHALVLSPLNEVLETTMDDVELDIVMGYWAKNRKYVEEQYA